MNQLDIGLSVGRSVGRSGFAHESALKQSAEWYTPPHVFDALALRFDLDPCAPPGGVPWIPAARHYCHADNGLVHPWDGRVWLNPPYGKETPKWLHRMSLHRHGIALVAARIDCGWFHDFATRADAINFMRGRLRFVNGDGKPEKSGNTAGSILIAWGADCVEAIRRCKGLTVTL